MNLDNAAAQMRKGILELCILGILHQGEAYPSDLIEKLRKAGISVVEGTIYPLLTRLKNGKLLAYRWEESTSGPPRKYYTITEEGKSFYLELNKNWDGLVKAVKLTTSKGS